jgi:hypothetical protein
MSETEVEFVSARTWMFELGMALIAVSSVDIVASPV